MNSKMMKSSKTKAELTMVQQKSVLLRLSMGNGSIDSILCYSGMYLAPYLYIKIKLNQILLI